MFHQPTVTKVPINKLPPSSCYLTRCTCTAALCRLSRPALNLRQSEPRAQQAGAPCIPSHAGVPPLSSPTARKLFGKQSSAERNKVQHKASARGGALASVRVSSQLRAKFEPVQMQKAPDPCFNCTFPPPTSIHLSSFTALPPPRHSQGSPGCWSPSRLSWCERWGYTLDESARCGAREANNRSHSRLWTVSSHPKRSRTDAERKMRHCAQKGLSRSPGGESDGANRWAAAVSARCRAHKEKCCFFFFVLFQIWTSFGFVFFLICCDFTVFFSDFRKFMSRPCTRIREDRWCVFTSGPETRDGRA